MGIGSLFDLLNPKARDVISRSACYGNELQVAGLTIDNHTSPEEAISRRQRQEKYFMENSPSLVSHNSRYGVSVRTEKLAGVRVDIFTPSEGVSPQNEKKILINLHGGAFIDGANTNSHLESIPIASLVKIEVVSVDYRMAPEHRFPAATLDVVAVYKKLLHQYDPKCIGMFGCSAGALLAAQALAHIQNEGLPLPGAVGMFCGAAEFWMNGVSGHILAEINGYDLSSVAISETPYFSTLEDLEDASAFPANDPNLIAHFPPALLISSTLDFALSSVVNTHSNLVKHGVEAELHVWEGVSHAFIYHSDLTESQEAYEVISAFFKRRLQAAD